MPELERLGSHNAKILSYVEENQPVTAEQTMEALPSTDAVKKRMSIMTAKAYLSADEHLEKDGYRSETAPPETYTITALGRIALQEYISDSQRQKRELWIKSAWIPIIVSFATTISTNYIIPKLPALIKWSIYTLSNIFS